MQGNEEPVPACTAHVKFIRVHTEPVATLLVPEITLRAAKEPLALWHELEAIEGAGTTLPFWAFPWAGGQALARYVLDHAALVQEKVVLDLAAGSGIVAIAAAQAGAQRVIANEVDPYGCAAIWLNAEANGASIQLESRDVLDGDPPPADIVLAGDVFYEQSMARRVLPFLLRAAATGTTVLIGDPGRQYLPRNRCTELAAYTVPVSTALEDSEEKPTWVLQLLADSPDGLRL